MAAASIIGSKRAMTEAAVSEPDAAEDVDSGSEEEKEILEKVPIRRSRPMNKDEYSKYIKQACASEGFDVDKFEGTLCGGVVPVGLLDGDEEELSGFCQQALQTYNKAENSNYAFVELVKANGQAVCGLMFYITFKARAPSDSACVTFQARVWKKICNMGSEVELCRKKPPMQ